MCLQIYCVAAMSVLFILRNGGISQATVGGCLRNTEQPKRHQNACAIQLKQTHPSGGFGWLSMKGYTGCAYFVLNIKPVTWSQCTTGQPCGFNLWTVVILNGLVVWFILQLTSSCYELTLIVKSYCHHWWLMTSCNCACVVLYVCIFDVVSVMFSNNVGK